MASVRQPPRRAAYASQAGAAAAGPGRHGVRFKSSPPPGVDPAHAGPPSSLRPLYPPGSPTKVPPRSPRAASSHRQQHPPAQAPPRQPSRREESRPRRPRSRSRRRDDSSSESGIPDFCPDDLLCTRVNDPDHQAKYRHTCRLVPCEYLWMTEHRRLFCHSQAPMESSVASRSPHGSPHRATRDSPHRYPAQPPLSPVKGMPPRDMPPFRPPPFAVPHTEVFEHQVPPPPSMSYPSADVHTRALQAAAARSGSGGLRVSPHRRVPSPPHPDQRYASTPRYHHPPPGSAWRQAPTPSAVSRSAAPHVPPATTAAEYEEVLQGRMHGFSLLKELEALCMEVRTMRHLHHYRHTLARQHSVPTVAYQLDHSLRRVGAAVRRVRRLQREIPSGDLLHHRADDEVAFAEELMAGIDTPAPAAIQARRRSASVPASCASPHVPAAAPHHHHPHHHHHDSMWREPPLTPQPAAVPTSHRARVHANDAEEEGDTVLLQASVAADHRMHAH